MTRKLINCPKCGKKSFIELTAKEEMKQIKQKDFDRILVVSVPPPKKWKEDRKRESLV